MCQALGSHLKTALGFSEFHLVIFQLFHGNFVSGADDINLFENSSSHIPLTKRAML